MSTGFSRHVLRAGVFLALSAAGLTAGQPTSGPQEPEPTTAIRDCSECPELVVVPAGQFLMGSPPGEPDRGEDEGPQHTVTISSPFAVGKYEVTFDEWEACVTGGSCASGSEDGWGRGRRPVIYVSFEQAFGYTEWLSRKTGRTYRLLTEVESTVSSRWEG